MSGTSWQDAQVAHRFLDRRRAAIPYAADQLALVARIARHFRNDPGRVLDLGSGDGILARVMLDTFPAARATLLDHSRPMLERAREAMAPYAGRCDIVEGDLGQNLAGQVGGGFDLIVSGFAIHHLETARKRALSAEIYQALTPGGLFVNLEHVASAASRGEALFDELYVECMAAKTGTPLDEMSREYHTRRDKADNKLDPLETQLGWLRAIGFVEVDCFFKWLELAIFAGQRPG